MTLLSDADGTAAGTFDTGMAREDVRSSMPFGVLTPEECEDRDRNEAIVQQDLKSFVEVGGALMRLRDQRLYRETHDTFEAYCQDRWELSKRHADRLIAAAEVISNLGPIGPKPSSESQARPLSGFSPDQQREVWQKAVTTAPNGKVTAAHVESVAREYRNDPEPESRRDWNLQDATRCLIATLYEISRKWPPEYIVTMSDQLHSLADELRENGELCP
jgi:hypothetical protein